jgi:NADP-dependent 3-hydroxy acid dehydrogenase YdfG
MTRKTLWVVGAGSGMGRAAAVEAAPGRNVVLTGRRTTALQETAELVEAAGGAALVVPADVQSLDTISQSRDAIIDRFGAINDLVLSAGLNTPRRTWAEQSLAEVNAVVATNLTSVIAVADAVLPELRARGGGQIVVVSSYSAWRFTPYAGVAYSASKSALAAVCQTINAQEATHGIRACHLCPGDVNSDFLDLRPVVPDEAARSAMLSPDDVGRAIRFVLDSPPHVRIDELVISPVSQV